MYGTQISNITNKLTFTLCIETQKEVIYNHLNFILEETLVYE